MKKNLIFFLLIIINKYIFSMDLGDINLEEAVHFKGGYYTGDILYFTDPKINEDSILQIVTNTIDKMGIEIDGISFDGCRISNNLLIKLANMFRWIKFFSYKENDKNKSDITDEALYNFINRCHSLESFEIEGNELITFRSLEYFLRYCPNLKNLKITNCLGFEKGHVFDKDMIEKLKLDTFFLFYSLASMVVQSLQERHVTFNNNLIINKVPCINYMIQSNV